MCTELFKEIDYVGRFWTDPSLDKYDYFGTLDKSIFTLFVMVTLDWAKVSRATMQVVPWSGIIFSTFVTFSSFVLYNLIIAVVCDAVKMTQDQDDVLMVEKYYKEKLEEKDRILNLREKVDKMTKQQNDLLVMVKMMLQQLELVDEPSRKDYEETLFWLENVGVDAKTALEFAVKELDNLDTSNDSPTRVADAWDRVIQERFALIDGSSSGEQGVEMSVKDFKPNKTVGENEEVQDPTPGPVEVEDPPMAVRSIGLGSFQIIGDGSTRQFEDVKLDS